MLALEKKFLYNRFVMQKPVWNSWQKKAAYFQEIAPKYAELMELADMQDLGSCGQPYGFESHIPHYLKRYLS